MFRSCSSIGGAGVSVVLFIDLAFVFESCQGRIINMDLSTVTLMAGRKAQLILPVSRSHIIIISKIFSVLKYKMNWNLNESRVILIFNDFFYSYLNFVAIHIVVVDITVLIYLFLRLNFLWLLFLTCLSFILFLLIMRSSKQ